MEIILRQNTILNKIQDIVDESKKSGIFSKIDHILLNTMEWIEFCSEMKKAQLMPNDFSSYFWPDYAGVRIEREKIK